MVEKVSGHKYLSDEFKNIGCMQGKPKDIMKKTKFRNGILYCHRLEA